MSVSKATCPVCHRQQPTTSKGVLRMHYSPTRTGSWCPGSARPAVAA